MLKIFFVLDCFNDTLPFDFEHFDDLMLANGNLTFLLLKNDGRGIIVCNICSYLDN